jgi:RNA polymerase sigma factor (sigma-70 family)
MTQRKRSFWDQMFSRSQSDLAAFIRRRVRRSADASDLTQEAYLRILRADRAELIRNPEAYLYTVATNLIREQEVLERRWGRSVDAADTPADPALMDFRTPEEQVDTEARLAHLSGLIENLPPKLQTVLILQYRDGLTYEQIAKQIGVTTHAVKKYVMQGLALCRKQLQKSAPGATKRTRQKGGAS